jgi:hypothetical protein
MAFKFPTKKPSLVLVAKYDGYRGGKTVDATELAKIMPTRQRTGWLAGRTLGPRIVEDANRLVADWNAAWIKVERDD